MADIKFDKVKVKEVKSRDPGIIFKVDLTDSDFNQSEDAIYGYVTLHPPNAQPISGTNCSTHFSGNECRLTINIPSFTSIETSQNMIPGFFTLEVSDHNGANHVVLSRHYSIQVVPVPAGSPNEPEGTFQPIKS